MRLCILYIMKQKIGGIWLSKIKNIVGQMENLEELLVKFEGLSKTHYDEELHQEIVALTNRVSQDIGELDDMEQKRIFTLGVYKLNEEYAYRINDNKHTIEYERNKNNKLKNIP